MSKIYTVQELVQLLKGNLETRFPFVWVRGQVSNLSRPGSGHVYFTLKDENSCLDAVWFRQAQLCGGKFNPLTGEVYENDARPDLARTLQNGEDILCAGKITVYPPQGRMQLLVELAEPVGVGLLQQEFERLKKELWARGWFDLERKRPLPANPARVAVVTAPGGAVIHDFMRIAGNRGYGGEIRIYPSLVQGEGAPDSIAVALNAVFAHGWAEVAVLIRGGGSLEDLWAFNSEKVAETIINSPIPVLTGIGHEPDVSIADLVADVRAATPSHAAQLLWTERSVLFQQVDELEMQLQRQCLHYQKELEARLSRLSSALQFLSPRSRLERSEERLAGLLHHLHERFALLMQSREQSLNMTGRALIHAFSESDLMAQEMRAAGLLSRLEGRIHSCLSRLESGLIPESRIFSLLNQQLMRYENRLPAPSLLATLASRQLERAESSLALTTTSLESLNPMRPLKRGYALVRTPAGQVVGSAEQTRPGQSLEILLGEGRLEAEVTNVYPKGK